MLTTDLLLLTVTLANDIILLIKESAPHQQAFNCLTVIKIWS
jgi:hypothetical protein